MSLRRCSLLLLLLGGGVGHLAAEAPLTLLRMGNSLTWQMSGEATLAAKLEAAGIAVRFVGTQNWYDDGGYVPVTLAPEAAQASEAYPGMTVGWFTDPARAWHDGLARPTVIAEGVTPITHALTHASPDLILLLLGTNDLWYDARGQRGAMATARIDVAGLRHDFETLLTRIARLAPQATTFVGTLPATNDAGIPARAGRAARTVRFNEEVIRPVVAARRAAGQTLVLVDLHPLLTAPDDFYDDGTTARDPVHPGDSGIRKLNTAWFDAIDAFISRETPVNHATQPLPSGLSPDS